MENYIQMREVLAPSGVYLLLFEGEVVYVGKSTSIFHRLANHQWNLRRMLKGKPQYENRKTDVIVFDDVRVRFLPVDRIAAEEIRLIRHYQPKYNVQMRRPKFGISHLPAVQELFNKIRERQEIPIPLLRRKVNTRPNVFIQPPLDRLRRPRAQIQA